MKNYGFTYEGDIVEAAKWLPFAQSRLFQLASIGAMTQTYKPNDAITITVRTMPLHIHIKAGGDCNIYMESGIIQWELFGCAIPDKTALPWSILLASQAGNTINPAQGVYSGLNDAGIATGNGIIYSYYDSASDTTTESLPVYQGTTDSIAFGCTGKDQVDSQFLYGCDASLPPVKYALSNMCSINLEPKKYAISKSPSSIFSGVMQRYIQAMYGSTRFDMSASKDKVYPHIIIPVDVPASALEADPTISGDIEISPTYPNLIFIRRTEQYQYFFVIKSGNDLYVSNMSFSSCGEAIRKKLETEHQTMDVETINILETYALAHAKPGYGVIAVIPITGLIPQGSPIGYTWSSNQDGSKHTIVLHEEKYSQRMYQATEYELSVNFVTSDEGANYSISADIQQVGESALWNPRHYIVWAHDYVWGGNFWLSGSWPKIFISEFDTGANVPLYSYYYVQSNSLESLKKVVMIHDSTRYYASQTTTGQVGETNCADYGYKAVSVDIGNGYTTYVTKDIGYEGYRAIDDLSGYVSRNRLDVNAGTWTPGTQEDSDFDAAGISANRYDAYWDTHLEPPNCDGVPTSLLDGGEGTIDYTSSYYGKLVIDHPVYNSHWKNNIVDNSIAWVYVPYNGANGLVIGMTHSISHGPATIIVDSPCEPVGTGVYLKEYKDANYVRTSNTRIPTRHYAGQWLPNPPAYVINSAVNVEPYVESDTVVKFLINAVYEDLPIADGTWNYSVAVPEDLFQQGQARAVGISGLMGGYDVSFFGDEWVHKINNFGVNGIGGLGWG